MEKVGVWRGTSEGDFEVVNDYITIIRRIIRLGQLSPTFRVGPVEKWV